MMNGDVSLMMEKFSETTVLNSTLTPLVALDFVTFISPVLSM
jgi:hypothetical protein